MKTDEEWAEELVDSIYRWKTSHVKEHTAHLVALIRREERIATLRECAETILVRRAWERSEERTPTTWRKLVETAARDFRAEADRLEKGGSNAD